MCRRPKKGRQGDQEDEGGGRQGCSRRVEKTDEILVREAFWAKVIGDALLGASGVFLIGWSSKFSSVWMHAPFGGDIDG